MKIGPPLRPLPPVAAPAALKGAKPVALPPPPAPAPLRPDNDREGFSFRKAGAFLRLGLFRLLGRAEPAVELKALTEGSLGKALADLKPAPFTLPDGSSRKGVILFDFDDTLAPKDSVALPDRSLALVKSLLARGYEVAILSNKRADATFQPRYDALEALGVHVARNVAPKPSERAFTQTLDQLSARLGVDLSPANAVMVGDKQSTDGGSTLVGIPFVKVSKFSEP